MKNKKTENKTGGEFHASSRFPVPVGELFQWHARPGALERLSPPWDPVKVIEKNGGIDDGGTVRLKMKAGPFSYPWTARHRDYRKNRLFRDYQVKGPLAEWVHSHIFSHRGTGSSCLEDRIDFRFYFHRITRFFLEPVIRKKLERIFRYRHSITREDLKIHASVPGKKKMKIAVTGSGGVIGSTLIPFLETGGHEVFPMVRRKRGKRNEIPWDPSSGFLDRELLKGIDAVIHLSGEPIGSGIWSMKKKERIIESRRGSTGLLASAMAGMKRGPRVLISASAVGYYGSRGDAVMTEEDGPGEDFISRVCREWEDAAAPAAKKGIRVVLLRLGIVLTPAGGALQRLIPAFRAGLGGRMGSGRQYMSWVGIDDVLGSIHFALFNRGLHGPVNVVSPKPVTNRELTETLGRIMGMPALFPVPSWIIRGVFGEMGKEVLLSSTRVSPEKLIHEGYSFRHEALADALRHVLGKP